MDLLACLPSVSAGGGQGGVGSPEHRARGGCVGGGWVDERTAWTGSEEGKRADQNGAAAGFDVLQFEDVCFASRPPSGAMLRVEHHEEKKSTLVLWKTGASTDRLQIVVRKPLMKERSILKKGM